MSIADEYHLLTNPEHAALVEMVGPAIRSLIPDDWEARYRTAYRARWRSRLSEFDDAILREIGMTVDDLIELRMARQKRKAIGSEKPEAKGHAERRRTALLAIQEADQQSMSWSATINHVAGRTQAAHGMEHDPKTIDKWMRELADWRLISIEKPRVSGRGRPRKSE